MTNLLELMQQLTCHKAKRVLELLIQARQEILRHKESSSLAHFLDNSKIKTSVRDIGLAILFDSDTVASNFTDDLSKLSKSHKGLFVPVKTILHQVRVNQDFEACVFEVYVGGQESVFVGSVYDVIALARRLNLSNGYELALGESESVTLMNSEHFRGDHDMVLSMALQDPVTGKKPLDVLSKMSNSAEGPSSGKKGVYRAASRLEGYGPCYYRVANIKGVLTLSVLQKKRSGKHKWSKVGTFADGHLNIGLEEGHQRVYNVIMLDPTHTAYTHNAVIPSLSDINYHMGNRAKQHGKRRYVAL